jgi:hemin uptake protein HemP
MTQPPPADRSPPASPRAAAAQAKPAQRVITSKEILAGDAEVIILHGEEAYRLRVTRNGKLILQK